MIEALLAWAGHFPYLVNVQAMKLGVVGRPGAPADPLDLDPRHYLWLIEGICRDLSDKNIEQLDKLYSTGKARQERARSLAKSRAASGAARAAAVDDFLRFALG